MKVVNAVGNHRRMKSQWARVAGEGGFMKEIGFSSLRIGSIWIEEARGKGISKGRVVLSKGYLKATEQVSLMIEG